MQEAHELNVKHETADLLPHNTRGESNPHPYSPFEGTRRSTVAFAVELRMLPALSVSTPRCNAEL